MPEDTTKNIIPPPQKEEPPKKPLRHVVLERHEIYSGPLPPAEDLAKYNDAFQNGAERIFQLAERQADHRMEIEKVAVKSGANNSNKGLNFGLTVALVGLVVAGFLGYVNQGAAAAIIGSIDLVALVSVFIYGTVSRRTERVQKSKSMALIKPDASHSERRNSADTEHADE